MSYSIHIRAICFHFLPLNYFFICPLIFLSYYSDVTECKIEDMCNYVNDYCSSKQAPLIIMPPPT